MHIMVMLCCITVKLEPKKMSSQLHSGFIWVQAVAHHLFPWFRVTSVTCAYGLTYVSIHGLYRNLEYTKKLYTVVVWEVAWAKVLQLR